MSPGGARGPRQAASTDRRGAAPPAVPSWAEANVPLPEGSPGIHRRLLTVVDGAGPSPRGMRSTEVFLLPPRLPLPLYPPSGMNGSPSARGTLVPGSTSVLEGPEVGDTRWASCSRVGRRTPYRPGRGTGATRGRGRFRIRLGSRVFVGTTSKVDRGVSRRRRIGRGSRPPGKLAYRS
jgi:hypothetical protein